MIVYVAGPYSNGDVAINVRNAIEIGMRIFDTGHYSVIPHLTHFAHMLFPRDYEEWLDIDSRIIPKCDILLRIPGKSSGADKEVELAQSLNIPIFFDISSLIIFLKED